MSVIKNREVIEKVMVVETFIKEVKKSIKNTVTLFNVKFFRYAVYALMTVQTTLKITSRELMILLVMMFNTTCFTSDISQPVSYSRFFASRTCDLLINCVY